MQVELDEALIPEGYRFKKIGVPEMGQLVLSVGKVHKVECPNIFGPRVIVEKFEPPKPVWRLLEVGEVIREGDEVYQPYEPGWAIPSRPIGSSVAEGLRPFRRRIEASE